MMWGCHKMNVSVMLMGIIVYTCILGACAAIGGTRGRIVARYHAKELVIPLHLQQNAINMRTGKTYTSENCGAGCPPPWTGVIQKLAGLIPNVSEPLCEFSKVISPCFAEGDVCGSEPVPFTCCPTRCMPNFNACYQTEFLCVPKSIQPWMYILERLNFWDKRNINQLHNRK